MILLEDESPLGGVAAFVEDDGRAIWLYVRGEGRGRAAWLGNRGPAPDGEDAEARANGLPPRLARADVRHPEGRGPAGVLAARWLEDGEGLVVLEDGAPLGGIVDGAPYARDAVRATPWARPLDPAIAARAEAAGATWDAWRGARAEATWAAHRDDALARLAGALGPHVAYVALDAGRFPPLAVARFTPPGLGGSAVSVTVGASAFAMPGGGRLEIAIAHADPVAPWAPLVLGWLARWPWKHGARLGDGQVVVAPALNATWLAPESSGVVLAAAPAGLPPLAGTLWAAPLTLDEIRAAEAGVPPRRSFVAC